MCSHAILIPIQLSRKCFENTKKYSKKLFTRNNVPKIEIQGQKITKMDKITITHTHSL